jgi:hypothetical protein
LISLVFAFECKIADPGLDSCSDILAIILKAFIDSEEFDDKQFKHLCMMTPKLLLFVKQAEASNHVMKIQIV